MSSEKMTNKEKCVPVITEDNYLDMMDIFCIMNQTPSSGNEQLSIIPPSPPTPPIHKTD